MDVISVDYSGGVDLLGRSTFTRYLLDVIQAVDVSAVSVVVGLQGRWGSGKTHIFKSVQAFAEEIPREELTLLYFNPWMVSGAGGLVEALLSQLAATLTPATSGLTRARSLQAEKVAASLVDYAAVLSTVKHFAAGANLLLPGSGPVLQAIGSIGEKAGAVARAARGPLAKFRKDPGPLSLQAAKENVSRALAKKGSRIAVLVDDLDRLQPDEFAAMMQAIKAVADFPNIVYVLGYDPSLAAKLLRTALRVDGSAYMEKIVQVPVPVPEIPLRTFAAFARARLRPSTKHDEASPDAADFEEAWPICVALLSSPRDVERLRTRLQVAGGILQKEVNAADLLLIEAIALIYPRVLEWLRRNVDLVIEAGLHRYDPLLVLSGELGHQAPLTENTRSDKEAVSAKREAWRSVVPNEPGIVRPLQAALEFLFDAFRSRWTSPTRSGYLRIQEFRHWYRWSCFHDHQDKWSASELQQFLRTPQLLTAARIGATPESFYAFCEAICDMGTESFTHPDVLGSIDVFIDGERSVGSRSATRSDNPFGPARALLTVLRLGTEDERTAAVRRLVQRGSVWLGGSVLVICANDVERVRRGEVSDAELLLKPSSLALVREEWFKRCDEALHEHGPAFDDRLSPYALVTWMSLVGRPFAQLRPLAASYLKSAGTDLWRFFQNFSNRADQEFFPIAIDWRLVPPADVLYLLAADAGKAPSTFSNFYNYLEAEARKLLIARLRNALARLALR
jgi:hypothetical protein